MDAGLLRRDRALCLHYRAVRWRNYADQGPKHRGVVFVFYCRIRIINNGTKIVKDQLREEVEETAQTQGACYDELYGRVGRDGGHERLCDDQ